jgi:hypothetical protein
MGKALAACKSAGDWDADTAELRWAGVAQPAPKPEPEHQSGPY